MRQDGLGGRHARWCWCAFALAPVQECVLSRFLLQLAQQTTPNDRLELSERGPWCR